MLIEVARSKEGYVPDLSFGTHFFQDLVESQIRYLPLYPDEAGNAFNERFLSGGRNLLAEVAPEFADLAGTVRLIDVPAETGGDVLRVLMNAERDEAVALLGRPLADGDVVRSPAEADREQQDYWRWRLRMAERLAAQIDAQRFGVVGCYVFGSAKNATAGPDSDIDLLLHVRSTSQQRADLLAWLEGWSLCLDELNYLRTGYRSVGLLDVHLVTDEQIDNREGVAAKIGAVTDAAQPLMMRPQNGDG